MKWSILILTMPARAAMLERLLAVLRPQITSDVELMVRTFDASLPVGENREIMRQQSKGEYISFIDDDDLVPPHFVERILPLLDGVDYVGFTLEQWVDGDLACHERRSLAYGGVQQDAQGNRYRDIAHINPMRRELALRVPMTGWPAEDTRWADEVRKLRIVKTEHVVDEVLYFYLSRTSKPEFADGSFLTSVDSEPCPWRVMQKTKVQMLTGIAGLANPHYDLPEHSFTVDQIVEVHPTLAAAWIDGGIAKAVTEPKQSEPEADSDLKKSHDSGPVSSEGSPESADSPRSGRQRTPKNH